MPSRMAIRQQTADGRRTPDGLATDRNQTVDGRLDPPYASTAEVSVPRRWVESSRPTDTLPCKRVELIRLVGGPRGLDPYAQRSLSGRLWHSLYPIGVTNWRIERAKS